MESTPIPFSELKSIDPELYDLSQLAYHVFKRPETYELHERLAMLLPLLTYAKVLTGEVRYMNGSWSIGVIRKEAWRRDEFLRELSTVAKQKLDNETVLSEIAIVLTRYHQ